jgi:hypothetical protein
VLDDVADGGWGEMLLSFQGSTDPSTPFWLTGWSGELGNCELDISNLKGLTLELNADSQGEFDSTVSGCVELFNVSAVSVVYNSDGSNDGGADDPKCVEEEQGLCFDESSPLFKRREFLGNERCETCEEDPDFLCALSTDGDCLTALHLETDSVMLLNAAILQDNLVAFWMDDASKRGDFCDLCECREDDRTIDCSDRDL